MTLTTDTVTWGPAIPTDAELRLLGNPEGKRVLELGSGAGAGSIAVARSGGKAIAVDTSSDQLNTLRRRCEEHEVKVESHQADLADLAFLRADTIDMAFSSYGLVAVEDLDRVFRQVHRVLRPEGPLVFSMPHPTYAMLARTGGDAPEVRRAYHETALLRGAIDGPPEVPHTVESLFTSLSRANFRVDTVLEPVAAPGAHPGPEWSPTMRWAPPTLIVRARKQGI